MDSQHTEDAAHVAEKSSVSWDPKTERRLVWKVDLILMPIMTLTYGIQFHDKLVFNSASVFGMIQDLGLETPVPGTNTFSTRRYSTAAAAFYWGYLAGVLPIALILQKLPAVKALSATIFVWGSIVMLMVLVTNYPGAIAQRFFLGLVESAVAPGFVLLCSMWYTKSELPLRLSIWFSAIGIFNIFTNIINFAIGHAHGSLSPWKYMYLAAGSVTILWSLVVLIVLPESPATSHRWFNEAERAILVARMRGSLSGVDVRKVKWYQIREALRDYKLWSLCFLTAAVTVTNGGVTVFGSLIVKSLGYSSLKALLMQTPGGASVCISLWLTGYLCSRFKNTFTIWIAVSCLPPLVGSIIVWRGSWQHRGLPVFGYCLIPSFAAPYLVMVSFLSANVAGGTKKACATGAVFIGYNVGNIIGPYIVNQDQAGLKYRTTWIVIITVMVLTIISSFVLRILLSRENARRDRDALALHAEVSENVTHEKGSDIDVNGDDSLEGIMHIDKDLTDWEDQSFRYTL
ncbi:MFS general substrate transporter [Cytidiella melzeri]|nr:MFS general substrate transporter [Cytidiella melzeri]